MSEEKLYAVKNDEGKYWNFEDQDGFWKLSTVLLAAFTDEESAKSVADEQGGHVASLTEEPEKVVLTKEQAEIVEEAYDSNYPASYIAGSSDDEKLIMNAYVNGYTVAKEKKYYVKVPHTQDVWYYKGWDGKLETVCQYGNKHRITFTEAEIEHYGLQDCEKVETTNNGEEN